MKKKHLDALLFRDCIQKTIRVMKLVSFFLLVGFLQVSANIYSQTANIKISMQEVALSEVIKEIQKQTEFTFFYSPKDIEGVVVERVELEKASLERVLDLCLKGTNLEYEIVHKAVILRTEKGKEQPAPLPVEQHQKKNIKGKVLDIKGQPIPGTTVMVKGAMIGTITDSEGQFNLEVPADAKSLSFSFVGFITQEAVIGNQTYISIVLTEDIKGLEEIVVVGYGKQKKVEVTAAISTIGSKELMQSSSADLTNALSGKLAGLSALQNGGGQPGKDEASIYLRGVSTLNGTSPLVLIDGVPRTNMRSIDANEVESISVLKDASATAVFGVRGANGVILITTKRGQEGKSQLNVNFEQSFASLTREPERIHSAEYLRLRNLALTNDGLPAKYTDEVIAKYQNPLAGLDPKSPDYAEQVKLRNYIYCDHDYYREYIKRYTPQTRASVDVTGGNSKLSYFMNAGYLHQGGNLITEPESDLGYDPSCYMDRFTFRSNLDYKITNSLSAFLNLGTYIEKVNSPNTWMDGFLYLTTALTPITIGPKALGGYGVPAGTIVDPGQDYDTSPYLMLNGTGFQNECRSNLNSTFGAKWDLSKAITQGLSMKGMISYDSYGGSTLTGNIGSKSVYAHVNYDTNLLSYSYKHDAGSPLSIGKSYWTQYNVNLQGSVNYNRKFGKHEFTGLLLFQRDFWDYGSEIPHNVIGIAGRVQYNYDSRYFAEYDLGYNGSEQFGPGHRFGYFPAYSASWVLTNEGFLKDNKAITSLKIRASYGKVGNDKISNDRFLYLDNIVLGGGFLGSLGNGQQVNEGLIGNPNISWEVASKKNLGVDFSFFKNLSGTFDYFIEHRTDILIQRNSVPAFQGVDPGYALSGKIPKANMGRVNNRGYELELNYNLPVTKDLLFKVSGNYSYAHNIVKAADEVALDESYVYRYRETGYSVGQNFGYLIDWKDNGGYWISQDQINSSGLTYGFGTPRVGDFKYIDKNEDGIVDDKDVVPIGYSSTVPEIIYGFTIGATYKNFDFTVFFQGVGNYSKHLANQNVWETTIDGTYYDYHMNSWTKERYLQGEKITYPALSTRETTNHVANDFFIMNCAYTRLKDIELGYTLPKNALSNIGISRLRIYAGGHNLFLWEKLRMNHLDPELDSPLSYPSSKMYNFGFKLTF